MSRKIQRRSLLNSKQLLAFVVSFILMVGAGVPSYAFHFPWDQGHDTTDWNDPPDPGPCKGGYCKCDPGNCGSLGSPVYLATGHFVWTDTDIVLKGRPLLSVSRTYNSNDPRDGLFGNGWSFDHDRALSKVTQAIGLGVKQHLYIMRLANGKRYIFQVEADGSITPPPGVFQRIEPQPDGTDRLVDLDGSYEVFAFGKMTSTVDRNGNALHYQYDARGVLTRVADTNGRFFDFTYASSGRIATITDHANRSWSYDYDVNGNLIRVTDPMGGATNYQYQSFQPTGDGNVYYQLTRVTDPTGVVVTQVTYNADRVRTYTEGANTYTFSYNTTSSVVTKTDSLNSTWRTTYNQDGLFISKTDPLNRTVSYQRDSNGMITRVTDELGNPFNSTYDSLGRLLSETDTRGTIAFEYQENLPWVTKVTSRSGRVSQLTYDARGNVLTATDSANAVTRFVWNVKGDLAATTNALNQQSTVSSNAIGLPLAVTDALGRTTSFTYDSRGNTTSVTNAGGETVQYEYDLLDRVTHETNAMGHVTRYDYDAASRRTRVIAPNSQQVSYAYDSFGRLNRRTNYDGRQHIYTYRADNLAAQITQPSGALTTYTYDAAKQPTQVNVGGEVTSFQYTARGELRQASNPTGTVNMTYDNVGRLLSETVNGQTIQYSYSNEDELTQLIGLGKTQSYQYDNRGLLTQISGATGQYNFGYDALGRRTQLAQPNGNVVSYQYDTAGQLSQIQHAGIFNANYRYQFDSAGRIASWTGDGVPKSYQYDTAGRLIRSVDDFGTTNYQYDALGNILGNGRTYDNANRLILDANTAYSYDANGNLTQKQETTTGARVAYTWNAKNQLLKMESYADGTSATPVSTTTYTYGPLGRRWSKTVDGVVARYVYSGDNRIGTLDGSNAVVEYVSFSGMIDEPVGMEKGGNSYFFHSNHQGSVMALTDGAGTPASYQYDAYGKTTVAGNSGLSDFRYTGREFGGDDIYYYRTRYYNPLVNRFINEDPIGLAGGINTYTYVEGNPISYIDPLGLAKSGQTVEVPGTTTTVRVDPPHVPGQQKHAHICQKGCEEIVINVDGTSSHGTVPSKVKNKKVLRYLAKKGFRVALKCAAPVFFIYDWSTGGVAYAVDELTWPVSEAWSN